MVNMEEERRRWRERNGLDPDPGPQPIADQGDPGPTAEAVADRRAALARPYIEEVRRQVFGSPAPPFESEEDPALRKWKRANRLPASGSRPVEEAAELVAKATGFDFHDVDAWILTGRRPSLAPWAIGFPVSARRLPDGTRIVRVSATITFNVPVQESEIRRIWRRVNRAWTDTTDLPDLRRIRAAELYTGAVERPEPSVDLLTGRPPRRKTPQLSEADRAVLRFVDEMPDATWKERAEAWGRAHGEAKKPDTLSKTYRRAAAKLNAIERRG